MNQIQLAELAELGTTITTWVGGRAQRNAYIKEGYGPRRQGEAKRAFEVLYIYIYIYIYNTCRKLPVVDGSGNDTLLLV